MAVDIYQHQTIMIDNSTPLTIWIGDKDEVQQQFERMLTLSGNEKKFKEIFKFCPNISKLSAHMAAQKAKAAAEQGGSESDTTTTPTREKKAEARPTYHSPTPRQDVAFDIDQIKIGEMYE